MKHFTPYPTPGSVGINVLNIDLRKCHGVKANGVRFPAHWPYFSFAQIPSYSGCCSYISRPKIIPSACLVANPTWFVSKDDRFGTEGVSGCIVFPYKTRF